MQTMQVIEMTAAGEPDVLTLAQRPVPEIRRPSQVRVRMKAAGVNPIDTKLRRNGTFFPKKLPAVLGLDGAGVVDEVGSQVSEFAPGDEVYFCCNGLGREPGSYAEFVLVESHALARKPANLSFTEAAAVPLVLITAWEALHDRVALGDGQQILIHAGAGGVGHVAIQLARLAGARIATTVSTDNKAELVRELGAGKVILYRDQNVVEETLEWTGGRGADVVMDNVGGKLFEQSFPAVRVYGDLVTLLQPGTDVNWSVARQRNLRVSLEVMLTPWLLDIVDAQIHQARILAQARMQFDAGQLKVLVSDVLPLREAARAHELIETGSTTGKIVLEIGA